MAGDRRCGQSDALAGYEQRSATRELMALTRRRGARSLAASPGFIPPQLAALVKHAPDRPAWLHEIKLDGYRMHGRLDSRDAHRALVLAEHNSELG